jgi:RNA 3'-terminal phosphate cyclase (ATP)
MSAASLVPIDGAQGEGGGQILRTALTLAAVTGRGFQMTRIRAGRSRPGLRPQHVAAVRAVSLACQARVGGAFEGSPDLRFEPGEIGAGEFRFEIQTAGAATLVLQATLPALARSGGPSRVTVTGGTHVPMSPSYHYLARHWAEVVRGTGLVVRPRLVRAGFYPPGGGEIAVEVDPWQPRAAPLELAARGALVGLCGVSGAARLRNRVAERQRDAAAALVWEQRRLELAWDVETPVAASPGSYVQLEALFESGRAAFCGLGERRVRAELLGERAARALLRFLDGEAAVDPHLADQLVVPLLLGAGGRVATSEVTLHLTTVAAVARLFDLQVSVAGRVGGPGVLEVEPC